MASEYLVIEDNGGGLHLYVFDANGINGGAVIYSHSGYEYVAGQLAQDLGVLDAGGNVADWDGCGEDPQAEFDFWDDESHRNGGWRVVAQGADGKRTLFADRMGAAANEAFGITAN